MPGTQLLQKMSSMPGFLEVRQTKDIPVGQITYAVVQGENILTIGSGEDKRLKVLMGNRGSHNKAPLIGLCARVYSQPIRFFVCRYTESPDGRKCSVEERELQRDFGETHVDGHLNYRDAMRHVRSRLGIKEGEIEGLLLDLMETHGDVLNHALNTASTAAIVENMFLGRWKRSKKL